jgi:glycosyltransferase involved in cell wall biosynthesis
MKTPKASVIISTYNQPDWLRKVLWSYEQQTDDDFEVIIADDGSTEKTQMLIDEFVKSSKLKIKHIWQEDAGFRKTRILNKAIEASDAEYLIFTDGDCLARKDFVERHLKLRRKGHFLSAGYYKLTLAVSECISRNDIIDQVCFDTKWISEKGMKRTFKNHKLNASGFKEWFLNNFTPTKKTWDGCNVSGWKQDIVEVNGYDERMQYGGEDRELGERLMNKGVKGIQARYSLITLHLFHERPYENLESTKKNKKIRSETRRSRSVFTKFGITQVNSS